MSSTASFITLPSAFGAVYWATGLAVLAVALLVALACWWRQREPLAAAQAEAASLRDALQALQHRHSLLDTVVRTSPLIAFRCEARFGGPVQYVGDAIETLTGWPAADFTAGRRRLHDIVNPEDLGRLQADLERLADQNEPLRYECRVQHRDGRSFWVNGHCQVRSADDGRVLVEGVIIDISERKAMEIALRHAKEHAEEAAASKTMFLANMGHEVRTPLNAIIGFSEIVLRNELDAIQRQYVFKVRQAAHALLHMMNDILDMSKLERGQLTLASGDFSLFDLAHEALQAQHAAADRKGLALRLETDPALGEFFCGDALRLRQVLDKLLDNAVKFTQHGTVRLQLARQQDQVLLAVHDTGIGIAPERQARMFEAFTQDDASASRRFGGTGLGTTLALQLAERMGGSLTLHSEPGIGSVFRMLVPLVPVAVPAAAQAAEPSNSTASERSGAALPAVLQPLEAWAHAQPWADSLRQAIDSLRSGDHADATLPALLQNLRCRGLNHQAAQVEHALAMFDLDRAAELLETLPARL